MPRGLGDSPLKREKKLRHTSSRASRSGSSLGAEQTSPVPSGLGDVHAMGGVRSSYNDVFFQRRAETVVSPVASVQEETHVEIPAVTAPEPTTAEVPNVPIEEVSRPSGTTAPVEAVTNPIEVAPPVEETHEESAPSVAEPRVESTPSVPTEGPVVATSPGPETTTESSDKRGFFGRIFGKWRKS